MHCLPREAGGERHSESAEDDCKVTGGENSEGRVEHDISRYNRFKLKILSQHETNTTYPNPDVEIDGKGVILISSEEGDMEGGLGEKCLSEFDIKDGAILTCDDFNQKYCLKMILYHA